MKTTLAVLCVAVLAAPAALACFPLPDADLSIAVGPVDPVLVHMDPGIPSPSLNVLGGAVAVIVQDANATPMAGFDHHEIRLVPVTAGAVTFCEGWNDADSNTNAAGETAIIGGFTGGGWSQDGMQVEMCGQLLSGPALRLHFNSCDIDGDLDVDLADIGVFAEDLAAPDYRFRSDFTLDGEVDLADVGMMSIAIGTRCP